MELAISLACVAFPVLASVAVHLEAVFRLRSLAASGRWTRRQKLHMGFWAFLLAHLVEILLFAAAFLVIDRAGSGGFSGLPDEPALGDYLYFSVISYTTIGFGDILPLGYARTLTAICALTGLILIAITATYIVVHMNRLFAAESAEDDPEGRPHRTR